MILTHGARRVAYEIRSYARSPDAVFFTFLFPVVMLGIFAAAFSSSPEITVGPNGPGVTFAEYYLPSMLAAGLLLSGIQNLAVDIATERSDGTLKRLGGTPLSPISYFVGKIGMVLVTGILQAALLLFFASVVLRADLPSEPENWRTFGWVFALGLSTSALLGIALSALPRSARSATAVITPILLVLQFISGIYLPFYQLPEWMQNASSVFPLKWMAQGMRAALLPEEFALLEQNEVWDLGAIAAALAIWLVVGLVLSRLTFRWLRRDS